MKFSLLIFFLFNCLPAISQSNSISGSVYDERNAPIGSAEINIKSKNTLSIKVLTDINGFFFIKSLPSDRYYVIINVPGYERFEDSFRVSNNNVYTGAIHLFPAIHMLDEVKIVNKVLAMAQRDDTLEFNSGAYKVNPDADAADLVRKMPSIEVNGSGITAQGESVAKVLIDGRPFFGSDPYASLKNLPAEVIDKVQVYNEKSDQEQFTGFNEGVTKKTINIITRPNKRNGAFGNAFGGYGKDDSNDGKYGMGGKISQFNKQRRLSLTAQSNNVNVQNFTGQGTSGSGGGIGTTNAGGINYSDTWGKKMDVTGSYFFNAMNTKQAGDLRKTYVLAKDSGQIYDQATTTIDQNYNHRFSTRMDYKADSMNSLLWEPSFSLNNNSGNTEMSGNTKDDQEYLNQTGNSSTNRHTGFNFGNNLLLKHKFPEKGKTFSINILTSNSGDNGINRHASQNVYYGNPLVRDSFDQKSIVNQNSWNIGGNATYTVAHGRHGLFKAEYSISTQPELSENRTYNYSDITGGYTQLDSIYSNSFYSRNVAQRAGGSYQFDAGPYDFSAGAYYQFTIVRNREELPVSYQLNRNFQNLLPVAGFRYRFSKTKNLQLNYSTNTQLPSIGQLQNVLNNTNPLYLTTGNPAIRQSYRHNLIFRYNSVDRGGRNNFSASVTGSYTSNGITSNSIVAAKDTFVTNEHILLPGGSQLTTYGNIDGNSALNCNLSYGRPLSGIKCNLKVSLNAGISHIPALINNRINDQNNKSGGLGITLTSNISENIDFILSSNTAIVNNVNSLNPLLNTSYINESGLATINLLFCRVFVINTSFICQANSGLSAGYNQNYIIWNTSIAKKIFRKQQGEIKLCAYDLLNQNNNIQHTVTETYIQDARSNILQRYFLLVFSWKVRNFRKQ